MLKRRRRIAKYINALKKKKMMISKADVDKLKLQENEGSEAEADHRVEYIKNGVSIKKLTFQDNQQSGERQSDTLWHDSDEEPINLPNKNAFRKLMIEDPTEQQYEERLRRFYNRKYGLKNWATEGDGQQEQDLQDLLNQEEIYAQSQRRLEHITVNFIGRSTQKHDSVVTGLDFKNNIAASCGYDQKLKLWSLNTAQTNPQLRIKLQKDVYTEKYSLSGCYFRGGEIILGTLRQNFLVVDCQKWKTNFVSSSFLNIHPTFQQIRMSEDRQQLLLFSENRISLLDHKNCYQGSLQANQPLTDVQFGNQYNIMGVSNDVFYQWDTRTWRLIDTQRQCLGYTKLWTKGDSVAIGSKLGIVRLSNISSGLKQYSEISNLVTHVTELKGNRDGSLLVQCSKWKANAFRLIDISKGRCISGWPTITTKIGLPTAANFSSNNELCIANSNGYLSFFDVKNHNEN